MRLAPLALALAALTTGCFSNTYVIPRDELRRVAGTPTEDRAEGLQRLRVVQETFFASTLEADDPCRDHAHGDLTLRLHAGHGHTHGRSHRSHRTGGVTVRATGGGGGHRGSSGSSRSSGAARGGLDFDIKDGKALAVAVVALAAVGTAALIVTEGLRYDGWLEVAPHHPIHLIDGGDQKTVHLGDLKPGDIGPDTRAVIRRGEGIGATEAGRAPLDRQGFAWRMELGSMQVLTPDGADPSTFQGTMQLGYFPHQTFGLAGTLSLGWGMHGRNDLLAARYGVEAQYLPLQLGRFHLGAYAMGGWAYNARDNGDLIAGESARLMVGGGVLSEIDLATRLALSMRVGTNWRTWHRAGFDRPALVASMGFAIY